MCVNHEQLTLLNHENVVRVLRGLVSTTGSQVLLLRFAYSEDSARLLLSPPPAPPLPPKTPKPARHSPRGNPQSEPRLSQRGGGGGIGESAAAGNSVEEEAFRPESWHGSMRPHKASAGRAGGADGGLGRSVSASPHHASEPSRVRSHSLGGDSPMVLRKDGSSGKDGKMVSPAEEEAVGRIYGGSAVGDAFGGMMAITRPNDRDKGQRKGKRRAELWGEREAALAGGDGGSRHLYLGDMGNARAQRTLQSIAKDVQVCGYGDHNLMCSRTHTCTSVLFVSRHEYHTTLPNTT